MEYLEIYKKLKLKNDSKIIFDYLMNNLKKSIYTWNYFVYFDKVKENINKVERELNLLNSLIGKQNIEEEFISLLEEYPKTRTVLPLLIAVRYDKNKEINIITNFEEMTIENKNKLFNSEEPLTPQIKEDLITLFTRTGLKNIFLDKNIKNIVDYCFGIEVGLDTNARKNRTGIIMEKIVEEKIKIFTTDNNLEYISQANQQKIKEKWGFDLKIDKTNITFDFAIHNKITNKLYVIETNFYNSGGSKLKSTAGEYKNLQVFLEPQGVELIWITDGCGWLTSSRSLYETFVHNKYVITLELLKHDILKEIVK
jgi:type II restriction enzyme